MSKCDAIPAEERFRNKITVVSYTWGLVVNEALSFGVPVISTDRCGAGLEMISNGVNGFIVPSDDPDSIADRIEQALKLECFDAGIATAKKYSIEEMERYILKCIERQ